MYKYPEAEGGIKRSRDWKWRCGMTQVFRCPILYIYSYVKDVDDYVQRDILSDDYVWLIDREHKINVKTVDWVSNP